MILGWLVTLVVFGTVGLGFAGWALCVVASRPTPKPRGIGQLDRATDHVIPCAGNNGNEGL